MALYDGKNSTSPILEKGSKVGDDVIYEKLAKRLVIEIKIVHAYSQQK